LAANSFLPSSPPQLFVSIFFSHPFRFFLCTLPLPTHLTYRPPPPFLRYILSFDPIPLASAAFHFPLFFTPSFLTQHRFPPPQIFFVASDPCFFSFPLKHQHVIQFDKRLFFFFFPPVRLPPPPSLSPTYPPHHPPSSFLAHRVPIIDIFPIVLLWGDFYVSRFDSPSLSFLLAFHPVFGPPFGCFLCPSPFLFLLTPIFPLLLFPGSLQIASEPCVAMVGVYRIFCCLVCLLVKFPASLLFSEGVGWAT